MLGHDEGLRLLQQGTIIAKRRDQRQVQVFAFLAQDCDVDGLLLGGGEVAGRNDLVRLGTNDVRQF